MILNLYTDVSMGSTACLLAACDKLNSTFNLYCQRLRTIKYTVYACVMSLFKYCLFKLSHQNIQIDQHTLSLGESTLSPGKLTFSQGRMTQGECAFEGNDHNSLIYTGNNRGGFKQEIIDSQWIMFLELH